MGVSPRRLYPKQITQTNKIKLDLKKKKTRNPICEHSFKCGAGHACRMKSCPSLSGFKFTNKDKNDGELGSGIRTRDKQ